MKTVPFFSTSTLQTAPRTIKVCMHVLGAAPTDPRVMRAATALVKEGYVVTVIDIADQESYQHEEAIQGIWMKHVLVSRSFISTRFEKWLLIRLLRLFLSSLLYLLQAPADIYHAHDVSALPACFLAACLRRKPLIYEAHEMPLFERSVAEMSRGRRWLHRLLGVLLAYIIPRCAGVITVSPPIVEEIRSRYGVPDVALIRSVPPYRAVPKSERLRERLHLRSEVRIALYQGYVQPNRGLDRLVRAAAFLDNDIVIVIMGANRGTTQAQLEALIASEGVGDRVKMLPPVPYADLLDWTASADIGLNVASPDYSLNVRYFLPNKLFEYLMAGLPVLTSPLEAMVAIVEKYDVGQVLPSLVPAEIGAALNRMLADATGLARQRSNALQAVRDELNWEKESACLLQLYQSISMKFR